MYFPKEIEQHLSGEKFETDQIGLSGSSVLLFPDMVLKIQSNNTDSAHELTMMNWLQGKLPVPRVIAHTAEKETSYLLMSRISGQMSCAEEYMKQPESQVRLLAEGLTKLWRVDISQCPVDHRLEHKLSQARYRVEHGLVDLNNVEPTTFGESGFKNPKVLLEWLYQNQPKEELVLSHGDYCLPNVFFSNGQVSGFLDLGRCGIADKWCDIALCYRSLSHNYSGRYNQKLYPGLDDLQLFQELNIEPDWEKIRYYILLDELF